MEIFFIAVSVPLDFALSSSLSSSFSSFCYKLTSALLRDQFFFTATFTNSSEQQINFLEKYVPHMPLPMLIESRSWFGLEYDACK